MTNFRCAAISNRRKGFFIAIMLSTLISACSSGSDDNNMPIAPLENNNTQAPGNNDITTTENISALTNVAGVNGWVCALGDGTFGAYSFFADLTGQFDSLIANGDDTFAINGSSGFTYVTTSANSVEILYEFSDGTSRAEVITNIAFGSEFSFTATSDITGSLTCSRRDLVTTSTESSVSGIPFGATVTPSGIYF